MTKRLWKIFLVLVMCVFCTTWLYAQQTQSDIAANSILRLSATDALGRKIEAAAGIKKEKKYVGIFYSLWLGQHKNGQKGIYNIQHLLDTNPTALYDPAGTPESPLGEFHFWGKPLYGYYSMSDPWVVTRHIELLTNASIDYLCIDATNAVIYTKPLENLLTVLDQFMKQGFKIPQVVFYTNSASGTTVDKLYNQFYKSGEFEKLWFSPKDKPMIIGITEDNDHASDMTKYHQFSNFIKPEMQAYFDVRESQWPNGDFNPDAIPWMSWQYPQWNHNGSVAVPVAQHSHTAIAASAMDPESSRGYNNITKQVEEDWMAGANFQTMWDAVFASNEKIDNVLVTSFNEWMAIKYANEHGRNSVFFVDVFNHEYSRDIEMMEGGYNDNFYLQLVRNARRFKLVEGNPVSLASQEKTIDIKKPMEEAWRNVKAVYKDFAGDALRRNFPNAVGSDIYVDSSNRNDIIEVRITHDRKRLYFFIKTKEVITPYNGIDENWMNILISDGRSLNSFAGYQYIINRKPLKNNTSSVEKSTGGYTWEKAGRASYTVRGNIMQVAIPLTTLGMNAHDISFDFKVADNVTHYDDIMDYYVSGDSAPIGRLNFSFE